LSDNNKQEKEEEIFQENENKDEIKEEVNKEEASKEANENKEEEEKKEETIESVKKELNVLQEKYVKVYADFDNAKKRLEKDKWNAIDYAIEGFAKDLLNSLDSLDMAMKSAENKEANPKELLEKLVEGLKLTSGQFENVLTKNNIEKIETDGDFDPNIHNAVLQVDAPEGKKSGDIIEVMQQGYKLKSRTLRPAMVSVAK
jgi:molecular chaperone GrpE